MFFRNGLKPPTRKGFEIFGIQGSIRLKETWRIIQGLGSMVNEHGDRLVDGSNAYFRNFFYLRIVFPLKVEFLE